MQRILAVIFPLFFLNIACAEIVNAAESASYKLSYGGNVRNYLIYRPASLNIQTSAPLVVMLHGGFGSGKQAEHSYNWDAKAEQEGFVVVYPDGIKTTWNAGKCCGPAVKNNIDDVGFLTQLIKTVSRSENIDPSRVYMTGISNGAAMSYRYACEGEYPIAAIGAVAGGSSFSCGTRPISVMAIHGLDDQHIPFSGGLPNKDVARNNVSWPPLQQTIDAFRNVDNCQPAQIIKQGIVQTAISNCEKLREVVLVTIEGAGHQWPGAQPNKGLIARVFLSLDPPSSALDATTTLWNFFRNQKAQD